MLGYLSTRRLYRPSSVHPPARSTYLSVCHSISETHPGSSPDWGMVSDETSLPSPQQHVQQQVQQQHLLASSGLGLPSPLLSPQQQASVSEFQIKTEPAPADSFDELLLTMPTAPRWEGVLDCSAREGTSSGGTLLWLQGVDFTPDLTVCFGDVVASSVQELLAHPSRV